MLVFSAFFATALIADPAATTTALQVAPAVTVYGEPTALNVQVFNPADGSAAQGNVQILDGDALIVTGELDHDGKTSIGDTGLALGVHHISAQFVPADASVQAASVSAVVDHDVEQAGSQIVVILNGIDTVGRTIIGVRVLAVSPSVGTPTGTVTLYLDDVEITAAPLVDGAVAIPTRKLRVGDRSVSIHYSGDANYVDSDSAETPLIVPPEAFDASIDPDISKMAAGDTKHFTLTLTPTLERDSQVRFVCASLPPQTSCAFDPPDLTLAADPQSVDVTVSVDRELFPVGALALAASLMWPRRKRKLLAGTTLFVCLACGDARPLNHVTVHVTAVSENISKAADLTLEMR